MTDAAAPRSRHFLINRNFALLWAGQSISVLGDVVFDTTMVLWIATQLGHGRSWAPLAVSGVLLATTLPTILLGPLAGVFVDRWEKRRTMLAMDGMRFLLLVLFLLLVERLPLGGQLGLAYAVVTVATACAQLFNPARYALIGTVVEEASQARAAGLQQVTAGLAIIVGPPLAAPLLFGLGLPWAVCVDALSFALSFVAIRALWLPAVTPPPHDDRAPFLHEFGAGLRVIREHQVLRTLVVSSVLLGLGSGAINTLNVFFFIQNLHAPSSLYGLSLTALGAGALVGAVLAGTFAMRIGAVRTYCLALLALPVLLLIYARLGSIAPALVVLFGAGLVQGGLNVAEMPILLQVTPAAFVGRVTAILFPAFSLASTLSVLVAGWLDGTILHGFHADLLGLTLGPIDTIFSGGAFLIGIGAIYALINLRPLIGRPSGGAP